MKLRQTLISYFILFFLLFGLKGFSCSLIYGFNGDKILIGFNEDNDYEVPYIWFTKKTKEDYGCSFFTYNYDQSIGLFNVRFSGKLSLQQGYNEKGLFFDFFTTPYNPNNIKNEKKDASFGTLRKMLQKCATVEEAIIYLDKYYFPGFAGAKMFLADATGDYVIYNGETIVRKSDKNFCIVTNFLENNKEAGDYPCERHQKGTELFEEKSDISVSNFKTILNGMHQNWYSQRGGTVYSAVFDLKKGVFTIFYNQDYEHSYVVNILEEINKETEVINLKNHFLKRSFPVLYKTLKNEGIDATMLKFHELQKDVNYNISESELLFFTKILIKTNQLKQAKEVLKICQKKYSNSEFVKEYWDLLIKEKKKNTNISKINEDAFTARLAKVDKSNFDTQFNMLDGLTLTKLYIYTGIILLIFLIGFVYLILFMVRKLRKRV